MDTNNEICRIDGFIYSMSVGCKKKNCEDNTIHKYELFLRLNVNVHNPVFYNLYASTKAITISLSF